MLRRTRQSNRLDKNRRQSKHPVRGQIERQPLPSVALIFADQNITFALLIMVRRAARETNAEARHKQ